MSSLMEMDETGPEGRSPMKRVGSTRKILIFNNIRQQLNEQLRCLDVRVESQVSLVQELQEFFRRRAELEIEYSKSLEKFARTILLRHKEQKQKREEWPIFSTFACWQSLIKQSQALSKNHATLADIYSVNIVNNLQTIVEDINRLYKKCRAIGYEIHEEILRVLQELHVTMQTYQLYESQFKSSEAKLVAAETQRLKLQQTINAEKLERSKKFKLVEKEIQKRKIKYADAKLKALKAKNEYQLCLEASNTTVHKYFVEDLSDLIDCMDFGFGSMISRTILMHVTADQGRSRSILHQSDELSQILHSIDCRADKQKFLEQHHSAFMIPKRFEFQGQTNEIDDCDVQKSLYFDMEQRLKVLEQRLETLRIESDEIWKTLETAEIKLLEYCNLSDYDTSEYFGPNKHQGSKLPTLYVCPKLKSDKQEIEDFYISKIREYMKSTSRISRLDAKAKFLRKMLLNGDPTTKIKPTTNKRKRIGRKNACHQPKLFGGSLEEYLECTGEQIPLIMKSCIRVINLFGLQHQGIFRVSGSQVEIANFRELFEKGEDPLADTNDASDINSVAGVLKLYLRELREPLFPIIYFDYFISISELRTKEEMVYEIKTLLQSLPRSVVIVIRYLFAFLNHLSEYADENMMDAYNLAVCFGPTLMPAPEDKEQVQYQNQINELIKNMIIYQDELFSKDLDGIEYEKFISQEPFIEIDAVDSASEVMSEDPDSEINLSEDDSEVLEAIVQFDFDARSCREITVRKGQCVILKKQVSNDWWYGIVDGRGGLIPDKYISLKIRGDREKVDVDPNESDTNIKRCTSTQEIKITPLEKTQNFSKSTKEIDCTEFPRKLSNKEVPVDVLDTVKPSYDYHDEAHAFESTVEFRNNGEKSEERNPMAIEKHKDNIIGAVKVMKCDVKVDQPDSVVKNCISPFIDNSENIKPSTISSRNWNENFVKTRTEQNCRLESVQSFEKICEDVIYDTPIVDVNNKAIPKAPDLVIDLPIVGDQPVHNNLTFKHRTKIPSNDISYAEQFALQNQPTLKKGKPKDEKSGKSQAAGKFVHQNLLMAPKSDDKHTPLVKDNISSDADPHTTETLT